MSNIRHILRLYTQNQTQSEIILQTDISRKVLKKHIQDFKESRLSFEDINELTDKDLEELFLKPVEPRDEKFEILFKMFPKISQELKRKGVSRKLLWKEYKRNIRRVSDAVNSTVILHHGKPRQAIQCIMNIKQEIKCTLTLPAIRCQLLINQPA